MEIAAQDAPLIMLVDDDPAIRRMVSLFLSTGGFRVVTATDAATALRAAQDRAPAAVILDVRLSAGAGGPDVLRALKADRDVPVIVVSGDADPALRIECMERGADDFLDKPFSPDQLERHLRYLLRGDEPPPDPDRCVRVGDLTIDTQQGAVFRGTAPVRLSPTGWSLLEMLIAHDGEPVLYRELLTRALGRAHAAHFALLDAYIARLRASIDGPGSGSKISDFHGIGYALAYAPVHPAVGAK